MVEPEVLVLVVMVVETLLPPAAEVVGVRQHQVMLRKMVRGVVVEQGKEQEPLEMAVMA
jgi:hypothetical protein